MSDLNTVTLTGRLGSDITIRQTPSGTTVGEANLAVQTGYGDKEKTAWIGLVLWGKTAESAAKYLGKGRKMAVSGRLDQDEWADKETGKQQRKTRVIVENWTFCDSDKKDSNGSDYQQSRKMDQPPPASHYSSDPVQSNAASEHSPAGNSADGDDIPF